MREFSFKPSVGRQTGRGGAGCEENACLSLYFSAILHPRAGQAGGLDAKFVPSWVGQAGWGGAGCEGMRVFIVFEPFCIQARQVVCLA
jgi:hypothetical protein